MSKPCRELSDEESLRGAALGITEVTEPQIRGVSGNKAGEEKRISLARTSKVRSSATQRAVQQATTEGRANDHFNQASSFR